MIKTNNLKIYKLIFLSVFLEIIFIFSSCQSVFSGGTGGVIVDAESTSSPKAGIANVDVYAYTSEADCNSDAKAWKEGTLFAPKSEYYAHTSSGADGSFSISKLVWETNPFKSDFGKDADVTKVYLLFYHENYGLKKGETLIVSDSSSDTVYVELTSIRKTTVLNLNFVDVSTENNTSEPVYVKVTVPQTTENNTDAKPKVYDAVITGSGQMLISYPRWKSDSDKNAGKENQPEINIEYEQSSDDIIWKVCYNGDNEDKNYAFRDLSVAPINKVIKNPSYTVTLYGKRNRFSVPSISGQYKDSTDAANDGVIISMKCAGNSYSAETPVYSIDCGEVTTVNQALGTTGNEKHGVFNGLGNGYNWNDDLYTGKYAETKLQLYVADAVVKTLDVRSDTTAYNINIE